MNRPRPWDGYIGSIAVRHWPLAGSLLCAGVDELRGQSLIAIVDDDAAMREALKDLLQVAGHNGKAYASGFSFFEDYAPGLFDLIITDLKMPKMDGVELLRRLQETEAPPPAIILTSSTDVATRELVLDNGAYECLTKPVNDNALLSLVGSILQVETRGNITGK